MGTRSKKTTRVSVSIEPDHYHDLNQIAERSDASLAWVIRRAIVEFLDRHQETAFGKFPIRLEEQQGKQ
jgi:predicted transcriptional regulator